MLKLNVNTLVRNLEDAAAVQPLDMSDGARYLYDNVYVPLAEDCEVGMSSLDFDNFTHDNIDELYRIYTKAVERGCAAVGFASNVNRLTPIHRNTQYV